MTVVTGDVAKRAAIVEVICNAFKRPDVPIHLGISDTLAGGPGQPNVPHYESIAHLKHRMDRPKTTAVDFLRETIRSRPGEIVLLSIGPFANIATLLTLDPEIPSLLRGMVSMGGRFFEPGAEWNAMSDPWATVATIKRSAKHSWIGLDVTTQCQLGPDEVKAKFSRHPQDVILPMAATWFKNASTITFHDPLAAVSIFYPKVCGFVEGEVQGEMSGDGMLTKFTEKPGGTHKVAKTVNVDAFFGEYFGVLER